MSSIDKLVTSDTSLFSFSFRECLGYSRDYCNKINEVYQEAVLQDSEQCKNLISAKQASTFWLAVGGGIGMTCLVNPLVGITVAVAGYALSRSKCANSANLEGYPYEKAPYRLMNFYNFWNSKPHLSGKKAFKEYLDQFKDNYNIYGPSSYLIENYKDTHLDSGDLDARLFYIGEEYYQKTKPIPSDSYSVSTDY